MKKVQICYKSKYGKNFRKKLLSVLKYPFNTVKIKLIKIFQINPVINAGVNTNITLVSSFENLERKS